jgi:hypothetical protein
MTGLCLLLVQGSTNVLLSMPISSCQLPRKFGHIERHVIGLLVLINIIISYQVVIVVVLLPTGTKGMNAENLKEKGSREQLTIQHAKYPCYR